MNPPKITLFMFSDSTIALDLHPLMPDQPPIDDPVRQFAALSHPTRLTAFRAVMKAGPGGVAAGDLAAAAGVSPSNLSAHLAILTQSGLVGVRAAGRHRFFIPEPAGVGALLKFLVQDCCDDHPEIRAILAVMLTAQG